MKVLFKNKKLEKYANDERKCVKALGRRCADIFFERLDDLYIASTLEDVRGIDGHYHELVGNRKGQWACDLEHPKRLVFVPHIKPIPEDKNGRYVWIEIDEIDIFEIVDYHG
ncbi:MAG: killer suppression protein HigA [Verrucomicrobia bacterium]|jgi:proteic killer suppression protein|nr:killer suppression protein HigA [Verrucomicrobiota bacterium]